ncbi:hypothetical protein OUK_0919 [Helicobacter pylori R037c]|nr:hypothetical protein OUK_0919 [Helicobacter pylori R037c]
MLFIYYIKISLLIPPIDTSPFFDLILIKVIFMIKYKLYQAISWRSFSFL